MKQISTSNPLNPNFVFKFLFPAHLIGQGSDETFANLVDELLPMVEEYLKKKKASNRYFRELDELRENKLNYTQQELTFHLYRIVAQVGDPSLKVERFDENLQQEVINLLMKDEISGARDLPLFYEEEGENRWKNIADRVYDALSPLYDFIAMYAMYLGDRSVLFHYKFKPGQEKNLKARKSPVVYDTSMTVKRFRQQNSFLGEEALSLLLEERQGAVNLWDVLDERIFRHVLADITFGALNAAWNSLQSNLPDFRYYLSSHRVGNYFAEYAALLQKQSSGGNAYPGRLYSDHGMSFNLSSGIQTQKYNWLSILGLRQKLNNVTFNKHTKTLKLTTKKKIIAPEPLPPAF